MTVVQGGRVLLRVPDLGGDVLRLAPRLRKSHGGQSAGGSGSLGVDAGAWGWSGVWVLTRPTSVDLMAHMSM